MMTLEQILSLLGCATIVTTVFHYLKIPTIVGFILTGMLVGPYGFKLIETIPQVSILNEIGLALLMFTIGLEFSRKKLKELSKSLIGLGLGMIGGVIALTVIIGTSFGLWSVEKSIAIGMVLSLSSSAIVLKLLQSNRELETPFGNASVGILLAQDISFVPMVLVLPFLFGQSGYHGDGGEWYTIVFKIIGATIGLFLFTRYVFPILVRRVLRTRSNELFYFMMFFIVVAIANGTHHLIGSVTLGAFLSGLVFASSPMSKQALSDILPLRDMFLGLLFTSVGMLVQLNSLVSIIPIVLVFTVIIFIMKSAIVYFLGRTQKYSRSVSIMSALVTFQVGEFSIVMIKEIDKKGVFTGQEVQIFMAVSVVTMMLTPLAYSFAPQIAKIYNRLRGERISADDSVEHFTSNEGETNDSHSIIVGYGIAGQALGDSFDAIGVKYVAIEMNYDTVKTFQKKNVSIIFGDASRAEILHSAGIETAKMIIFTVPSLLAAKAVVTQAREMNPEIEVIVRVQYQRGLAEFKAIEDTDVVVAEYELTLELIDRALSSYGLLPHELRDSLHLARKRLHSDDAAGSARRFIRRPDWETSSLIKPYKIKEGSFAIGKSLKDLEPRSKAGVSVATVYREGVGTSVPNADFILEANDIIHLVGKSESIEVADVYFTDGHQEVSD